eukprot:scaffold18453_cov33-Attheya_sp.AAC.1
MASSSVACHEDSLKVTGIAAAKAALAPNHPPLAWVVANNNGDDDDEEDGRIEHVIGSSTVTIHGHAFVDNVQRVPSTQFERHGDHLPYEPAVLTGCCDDWHAFSSPDGQTWSVSDLAHRLDPNTKLNLDGGPYFARMSMNAGKVTMSEYERYCYADDDTTPTDADTATDNNNVDGTTTENTTCNDSAVRDIAPLYLFDADVLNSKFANGQPVMDDLLN